MRGPQLSIRKMAPLPDVTQIRLNNIIASLAAAAKTLDELSGSFETPFLKAIANTTRSLLTAVQTIRQNRDDCTELMEQTHELIYAIIRLHINTDGVIELPPATLNGIGKFTETLHKIHAFVEAQHDSRIKQFFRYNEMATLLKDCKLELKQSLDAFKVEGTRKLTDIDAMQKDAKQMHQEVLDLIQSLADGASSDGASLMSRAFSRSENSSSSLPMMLPSEPQIFHGRELELSHIIADFAQQGQIAPRIAILGTGGMGKTSLARAVLHHEQITLRYNQHRVFVSCDSAFTAAELAGLIGSHLGLQTGKNAVQEIITHLTGNPPCLLILDNLETLWEPTKSRGDIEELLSLLSGINHLALIITMRGAERPLKVGWSHPFLPPLKSLGQDAARQTFFDIADDDHDSDEVDKILLLTDNMPLAISLIAHAVDSESCSDVLSRWEEEKTSLISEGHDQRSNLDFSISLSLTSPRLTSVPNAQDLLSLLSILPDGLGDSELLQIQFPIENILACKTTLLRTSLAYSDEHNRLKSLVPIREYMQRFSPPASSLVEPLLMHFLELLELYHTYSGTVSSSGLVPRVVGNFSNIQNILRMGLRKDNPDLVNTIYCTCYLDLFSIHTGRGAIPFFNLVPDLLPRPHNHRLEVFFLTQQLYPWRYHQIENPEVLIEQALTYLPHFSDSDVQCKFHNILGGYYWRHKNNIPMATDCFQAGLSLAMSTSNTPRQSVAMSNLAHVQVLLGNYTTARTQAHEAQKLAKICGDLLREAMALQIEAVCLYTLGNYKQSLSLCQRARNVLNLCGMAGHGMDNDMMNQQAQIHQLNAWALMGIAEIEVQMNLPTQDVQAKIDAAKSIFSTVGDSKTAVQCDTVLADLYLRDGKLSSAKELFEKCLKLCQGQGDGIATECLQRLGNGRRWGSPNWTFNWTIIFLAQSSKSKQKLGVYQAMQYLGDVFDLDGDYETAVNTITVALEGFTQMDVHSSRGECMVQLGDISKRNGNLTNASAL